MSSQNIEEIYEEYSKQVYKYLFCLTRDDNLSEDLTQETFYVAMKQIKKFRGDCKLYVWLCQIAKHLYYKEIKKNKKIHTLSLDSLETNHICADNHLEDKCVDKLYAYSQIDKLDKKSREIVYLRTIGEFSFKEIGEICGISENLARVTFYRSKQKIKGGDFYEKR